MAHKVFIAALEEFLAQIPASSSASRSSWSQFWWQFQWLTAWTQHPNLGSEKRKSVRGGTWEKLLWERGRSSGGNHPQVNGNGAQESSEGTGCNREGKLVYSPFKASWQVILWFSLVFIPRFETWIKAFLCVSITSVSHPCELSSTPP